MFFPLRSTRVGLFDEIISARRSIKQPERRGSREIESSTMPEVLHDLLMTDGDTHSPHFFLFSFDTFRTVLHYSIRNSLISSRTFPK